MTPPLDEEEEDAETRSLEAEARRELEHDGCPPCYPADLQVPVRTPPKKYESIIRYWQSFPGTGDVVLRAQLHDWHNFRAFQSRAPHRSRTEVFNVGDRASGRWPSRAPGVNSHSGPTAKRQNWLEDWEQFQGYQLHRLGRFAAKRNELEKELEEARRKSGGRNDQADEYASQNVDVVQHLCEVAQQDLERHKTLLQWIEQERQAMLCSEAEPCQGDSRDALLEVTRGRRPSSRRPRQSTCSTVLGKPKVLKATLKRRHNQQRGFETSGPEPAAQDRVNDSRCCASGVSEHRVIKSQGVRKKPVGAVPLWRARETQRPTGIDGSSSPERQYQDITQVRPRRHGLADILHVSHPPYPSQAVWKSIMTRSGRISRPPIRWVPG